ncbi:MAG: pilus assembly protein PilM, partial [Candidatus Omnitrophica bacterium]|nr:pilus assembly protein PilM [Candidatus Omnitrophota bacterium]
MKSKIVGLYLGTNSVGAVVVQGKDILSSASYKLSSMENVKAGLVNEDIRWEALINKTLRDAGAEEEKVYVSLSDRDFIFRALDMPMMRKKDIETSLNYEIEKYIPFKMSELEWDYKCVNVSKEKKAKLSFVGIKENNIRRVKDILASLKVNIVALEPACFSLLRVIKASSKAVSKIKNFAVLDFTDTESYLSFFKNGLLVFNRYISIPKVDNAVDYNKFIESISLSFQYFKREFKVSKLEKFVVITDSLNQGLITSLKGSGQLGVETFSPQDLTNFKNSTVENVKALGVVLRNVYTKSYNPVLRTPVAIAEGISGVKEAPPLKKGVLVGLACLGVFFLLILTIFQENKILSKKKEFIQKKASINIHIGLEDLKQKEIESLVKLKGKEIKSLKKDFKSLFRLFGFLEKIGTTKVLPSGLGFISLELSKVKNKCFGKIRGYIF